MYKSIFIFIYLLQESQGFMNVLVIERFSQFVTFINDFERNETEKKQKH